MVEALCQLDCISNTALTKETTLRFRRASTPKSGRIYVHAGRRMKSGDFPKQRDYIRESGLILPEEPPLGAIVGEVTITDCVDSSSSPWFCGSYVFLLLESTAYVMPIPYRGQLGFFDVDESEINKAPIC